MSDKVSINLAPGWVGLLGVVLVIGKLTGHIDISWFWATFPFWGGLAIVAAIFLLIGGSAGLVVGGAALLDKWDSRRRTKRARARLLAEEKARQERQDLYQSTKLG